MVDPTQTSLDRDSRITALQAFDALIKFLEEYRTYNRDDAAALDGLLSLLYYSGLDAGGPNTRDPRVWDDWLEAVGMALQDPLLKA